MGGLASRLPWTHGTMLMATLAIAGIPPFAGFFSKDEILSSAFASGHTAIWVMGLAGAVLTAFYMFRLYLLTFRGRPRLSPEAEHHLHESPPAMIVPLFVLAVLSVVGGLVGPPLIEGGHPFARWLAPVFAAGAHEGARAAAHEVSAATEWMLILVSVLVAAAGIAFAFRAYLWSPQTATSLRERLAGVHRTLLNKYWVDEFYDGAVVRPIHGAARGLWTFWDAKVVDGVVNGVGATLEGVSALLRLLQTGFVGTYALLFTLGVVALLLHFLRP
jgi:NADH-quinone oxidoreductase subunit L